MRSHIDLIHLILLFFLFPQGSNRIFLFVFNFCFYLFLSFLAYQGHTDKQIACIADSCTTHWLELFFKIPLIIYFEHLQHSAKEIRSSYFMFLPKPRYLGQIIQSNSSLTVFIKQYCTLKPDKDTDKDTYMGSFFFCQKLGRQVYLAQVPNFLKNYFHNNPLSRYIQL